MFEGWLTWGDSFQLTFAGGSVCALCAVGGSVCVWFVRLCAWVCAFLSGGGGRETHLLSACSRVHWIWRKEGRFAFPVFPCIGV